MYKLKRNIDEIDTKQQKIHSKIHTSLWIFKISRKTKPKRKSQDLCQMFVISKQEESEDFGKEIHNLQQGMDLKSYKKSIA